MLQNFRQTGSHYAPYESNRSSCLLGKFSRINLLKKDPKKLSVQKIEWFIKKLKFASNFLIQVEK